jgi:hypothetical protein
LETTSASQQRGLLARHKTLLARHKMLLARHKTAGICFVLVHALESPFLLDTSCNAFVEPN